MTNNSLWPANHSLRDYGTAVHDWIDAFTSVQSECIFDAIPSYTDVDIDCESRMGDVRVHFLT